MRHKSIAAVVGLVIVIVSITIYVLIRQGGGSESIMRITIAADFPMTGNLAFYGEMVSQGLKVAVENYNDKRQESDPEIILLVEDNFGSVQEGVKVFNKVVDQNGAIAVVSLFTPHSVALRQLSEQRQVVLYATVTSMVTFAQNYPFTFRDYISLPAQGREMAKYLRDSIGAKSVASLVVNDDYGRDAMQLCRVEFESRGGTWVFEEYFEQNDLDIRDAAVKVIAAKPDTIFLCGRELSLANAIRQLRELGFEGTIVSNNGFDTPSVFDAVGDAGQGVVFTSAAFDVNHATSDMQASFIEEYRTRFGRDPDYNAAHGYTVGQALCSAIHIGGKNPDRIREYLESYAALDILGSAKMSEDGDVLREVALFKLENGERVRLEKE